MFEEVWCNKNVKLHDGINYAKNLRLSACDFRTLSLEIIFWGKLEPPKSEMGRQNVARRSQTEQKRSETDTKRQIIGDKGAPIGAQRLPKGSQMDTKGVSKDRCPKKVANGSIA